MVVLAVPTTSCSHPDYASILQREPGSAERIAMNDIVPKDVGFRDVFANHTEGADVVDLPCEIYDEFKSFSEENKIHEAFYCFNTGSKSHSALAKYWFGECQRKHVNCDVPRASSLPARLLYIGETPKLKVVDVVRKDIVYACLSHRWGGVHDIPQLRHNNQKAMYNRFELSQVPRSFRDAIAVAQSLEIDYLWIDCLCINQEDPVDWARESSTMGNIFQNAVLTIAASGAHNPHVGCFFDRDPLTRISCWLAGSTKAKMSIVKFPPGPDNHWKESTLTTRAWCYQEYVLSPRILSYGKECISWRCMLGHADEHSMYGTCAYRTESDWDSDTDSDDDNVDDRDDDNGDDDNVDNQESASTSSDEVGVNDERIFPDSENAAFVDESHPMFGANVSQLDIKSEWMLSPSSKGYGQLRFLLTRPWDRLIDPHYYTLHRSWFSMVHEFSAGGLTRSEDKLIALAGLAELLIERCSTRYLSGLWEQSLILDLLWFIDFPQTHPRDARRGSSWSWSSVDGRVFSWLAAGYDRTRFQSMISKPEVLVEPALPTDRPSTGQISLSQMKVKARLKCAQVTCRMNETDLEDYWRLQRIFSEISSNSELPSDSYLLFNLYDKSGGFLGGFWPDFYPFESTRKDIYLMPVCSATRAAHYEDMQPYWATWDSGDSNPALEKYEYMICGLALVAVDDHTWSRVGLFHIGFSYPHSRKGNWFNDTDERELVII